MLEQNIIETRESFWSAPVVLIKKYYGSTIICLDIRKLNSITKNICYNVSPLNRTDDALHLTFFDAQ